MWTPLVERPRRNPCRFSVFNSDEEVCEVVEASCVPSRAVASAELSIFGLILMRARVCALFLLCPALAGLLVLLKCVVRV